MKNIPDSQNTILKRIADRDSKGAQRSKCLDSREPVAHHGVTQGKRAIGGSQIVGMVQKM